MYVCSGSALISCRPLPTFSSLLLSPCHKYPHTALNRTVGCAFWICNPTLLIVCLGLHRSSFIISSHKAVVKVSGFLWALWSEHDGFSVYARPVTVKWAAQTQESEKEHEKLELILREYTERAAKPGSVHPPKQGGSSFSLQWDRRWSGMWHGKCWDWNPRVAPEPLCASTQWLTW